MYVEEVICIVFNIEIRIFFFCGKKSIIWFDGVMEKIDSIFILKYEYMLVVRFFDIFRFRD